MQREKLTAARARLAFAIFLIVIGIVGIVCALTVPPQGSDRIYVNLMVLLGLGGVAILITCVITLWRAHSLRPGEIHNCLGYRFCTDDDGEPVIRSERDEIEARLLRGELSFDDYAKEIAHSDNLVIVCELTAPGGEPVPRNRREQLAIEHASSLLLTSEYADALEALAGEIEALDAARTFGEISDEEYTRRMAELC